MTPQRLNRSFIGVSSRFSVLLLALAPLLLSAGCNESKECERTRLSVFKAWNSVHQAAYDTKLGGVDEEGWTKIEAKTDLLRSAFETPQVTWDSANKARDDLAQMAQTVKATTDAKLEVFKTSAADAAAKQQQYYDACR